MRFHATPGEAQAAAAADLEWEQDRAGDGWREEVECICWGEVTQRVVQTSSKPSPDAQFDTYDEYELVDVAEAGLQELR